LPRQAHLAFPRHAPGAAPRRNRDELDVGA
jgi:hypothetical protein